MARKAEARVAGKRRTVFLVDDHPFVRRGIASCIDAESDLKVCGQAGTAAEALAGIAAARPDVVVVDISLPGRDGLDLVKTIRAEPGAPPVVMLSMHDESMYAERALRAGASAYLMKSAHAEDLVNAIRRVLSGEFVVGSSVLGQVLARVAHGADAQASPLAALTDRELEIFRRLGHGMARAQIAAELNLSVKTIEAHRASIRQKLGLRSATDVRLRAAEFLRDESVWSQPVVPRS
ncbi:MAG: response regulator transcription factor [Gemmatimonadetes bacterium]|nr:response regulator transcription factor [Gemmatimonadota bacterium]